MQTYKGHIQKGKGRATKLGFPTLNIAAPHLRVSGIFTARVLLQGKEFPAVAYADQKRKIVEVHVLRLKKVPNGEVAVELLSKLRENRKFHTDVELKRAIAEDIIAAEKHFGL